MGYVGNEPSVNFTSFAKQDITGDGGASYTLTHAVANANEIEVFVNNVRQEPTEAYTVSGTALTMTGNVASTDDFYVIYLGKALQTVVPPDASVGTAKIVDSAVTNAKIANSTIDLTTKITGTLPIANGGTGESSFAYLSAKLDTSSSTYTISNGSIITPFVTVGTTSGITMSSSNRFTVASSGVYQIKSRFYIFGTSNPSTVGYQVRINGSEAGRMALDTAGFVGSNGDFVTQLDWAGELSANDYIEFFNDSSTLSGYASSDHHNRISIYKIGTV